jgi:hypothetical protein
MKKIVLCFKLLLLFQVLLQCSGHNQFSLLHKIDLIADFPKVFVIHLSLNKSSHNVYHELKSFNSEHFALHDHDYKFYLWLTNFYSNTTTNGNEADIYFLHITDENNQLLIPQGTKEIWLESLNLHLREKFTSFSSFTGFQMDKVFFATTAPILHISYPTKKTRYLMDIRMLRVDAEFTTNGRDVFVPYIEPRGNWKERINVLQSRLFLVATCREAVAQFDTQRLYRSKLCRHWQNVTNSVVSANLSYSEFNDYYSNSDFCVILPGDTTSTAKLYKSIFAGCIPVIFASFREQLPFVHFLDWSKFAVVVAKDIINSKTEMENLLLHLEAIRSNKNLLADYKQAVLDVAPLFDYTKSDWPSVYHLTLLEMNYATSKCIKNTKKAEYAGSQLVKYFC